MSGFASIAVRYTGRKLAWTGVRAEVVFFGRQSRSMLVACRRRMRIPRCCEAVGGYFRQESARLQGFALA